MSESLLIIETKSTWRLFAVNESSRNVIVKRPVTTEELVSHVVRFADNVVGATNVFLATRSETAMTVSLPRGAGRLAHDRESLTFQLEAELPMAAETFVADFVLHDDSVMAIAIEYARYRPIVGALEAAGLRVVGIAPTATLVAWEWTKTSDVDCDFVMFNDEDGCELFRLRDRQPVQWWFEHAIENDEQNVAAPFAAELTAATLAVDVPLKLCNAQNVSAPEIRGLETPEVPAIDGCKLAVDAVRRLNGGAAAAWFDLRRDSLLVGDPLRDVRAPLRLLAATFLFFLLAIGAALFMRAYQYESRMQQLHVAQQELFAAAVPNRKVPAGGILSRLKSHVRAMRGARDKSQNVELATSSVFVLQQVMKALSNVDDFEVRQAAIENGRINLDVSVNSFADVNKMTATFQDHGFQMIPPSSTQDDDRVLARLEGRYVPATDETSDESKTSAAKTSRSEVPR